jgi:hypothetical protein
MGNLIPDICVCKEREGKSRSKRVPKTTVVDKNISILDYTGLLTPANTLQDVKSKLDTFTIYEISCVRNNQSISKHSEVKVKSFSTDMNLIFLRLSFITTSRAIIRVYYISEEDDEGSLEYNFKCKFDNKLTCKSNLKLLLQFLEENKNSSNENENFGRITYNYLKKIMEIQVLGGS